MGFLRRVFGRDEAPQSDVREAVLVEIRATLDDPDEELHELSVVGESYRQDALEMLAGPKDADGKRRLVGVTLRCEPDNEFDANAIRVEAMGQHVGYVARNMAVVLASAIRRRAGGVLEARGVIVGGWHDETAVVTDGSYGIRVWITVEDAHRLEVPADTFDLAARAPWPTLAQPAPGERRLSPTDADLEAGRYGSQVTVTCEEHYQQTIGAAMPQGWDPYRSWPLLVELAYPATNPHSTSSTGPCIEVQANGETIGYLTPKMTARFADVLISCRSDQLRATARATAERGEKGGVRMWRVKVAMSSGSAARA